MTPHNPPNQSCLDQSQPASRVVPARPGQSCLSIAGRRSPDSRSHRQHNRRRSRTDHEARCDRGGGRDCGDPHGDLYWWGDHRGRAHGRGIRERGLSL